MFIIVAISIVLFALAGLNITSELTFGLYWVVLFFAVMSGLSRVFITEEEKGTVYLLKLITTPSQVLCGKILFNFFLVTLINLVTFLLFIMFFENFEINSFSLFLFTSLLGNIGISVAASLTAAMIAKTNSKGNLYAVLSFPLLLPLFLVLSELSKLCIDGETLFSGVAYLGILLCYDVIMFTAGILLFDFIWKE